MQKGSIHFGLLYIAIILILIPASVFIMATDQKAKIFEEKVLSAKIVRKFPIKINNQLKEISEKFFENKEGEYSVFIKNFKTNEEYSFNSEKKYDSASLYKLWVMAVVYQKIKVGDLKESDILTGNVDKLEETLSTMSPTPTVSEVNPTPSTEPEKISMTVGEALEKMIIVSDNYSALLLVNKIGAKNITAFLKTYNFSDSNFKQPPQTSARDIAAFYELLYNGEIVDKEYSEKMLLLLKKQSLNDRIPKYLPENVLIAHKTGELFGTKHDAGIVFSKKGDYIITVLSDTKDYKIAAENIAVYSKKIFDYFTN